jgi:hypothetical protein
VCTDTPRSRATSSVLPAALTISEWLLITR